MKPIPENRDAVYYGWISRQEAEMFAKNGNISFELEVQRLNDMGFCVIDFDKDINIKNNENRN